MFIEATLLFYYTSSLCSERMSFKIQSAERMQSSVSECQHCCGYLSRSCQGSLSMTNAYRLFFFNLCSDEAINSLCLSLSHPLLYLLTSQCASKVNGGGFSSSKEFPDEVLRFLRSHPVMYNPVLPQHHRPVLLQTEPGRRKLTQIAVDRVQAQDGHYHVLYIGTGIGTGLDCINPCKT